MVNAVVIPSLVIAALVGLQTVIQKHTAKRLSHQMIFVIGSLGYFILTLFYIGWHHEVLRPEMRQMAVPAVMTLVVGTILGFFANVIYMHIIHHGKISLISAITSTAPIFVVGLSILILKESIGMKQIAGIGAIVGGIFLLC
jgi:drug/metabolite transporter (DMT)-like permease